MPQIYTNSIVGTVPDNIGALQKLQYFNLAYNDMSGSVPARMSTQLIEMSVMPSTADTQLSLVFFFRGVDENAFSGTLSSSWGKLVELR